MYILLFAAGGCGVGTLSFKVEEKTYCGYTQKTGVHIFILGRYRYYDDHCTVVIVIEGLPNCGFKKHTFSHMVCTHARFQNMGDHVSCLMTMAFALVVP